MEEIKTIEFDNVTFTYPLSNTSSLNDVSFSVEKSQFVVICGKSGCGKTTLLRHMKKNMMPYGELSGRIVYDGKDVSELCDEKSASEVGYVQQNPDNQLVTDKVWHELAFGLESLGLDNLTIKRRVAEMASYFDIQTWFRKDVSRLSGGQKQLLNLASVMLMQPKLLVLDEPTSQLDPIAASEFLGTLYKINRDLGVTVILSEHRLEEAFAMADRVIVMDAGKILVDADPGAVGGFLAGGGRIDEQDIVVAEGKSKKTRHPMFYGLPTVTKIFHSVSNHAYGESDSCDRDDANAKQRMARPLHPKEVEKACGGDAKRSPLSIREGRLWLDGIMALNKRKGSDMKRPGSESVCMETGESANPAVLLKNISFRYEKNTQDVLRDLNLHVVKGELFCVLGGNGVGKSTMLKAITSIIKIRRGKIKTEGRLAMLPQNPQALFTEISVEDELMEALYYEEKSDESKVKEVLEVLDLMELSHLRKSHPYDLSGGEQQRLALGKVLLLDPDIILLDEPTKGLDPFFKISLAKILKKLTGVGKTVLMVSHDIEFCAEHGDRCAMFFDGGIVSVSAAHEFFSGNNFYTTMANKIAREHFPGAVTWEEVVRCVEALT